MVWENDGTIVLFAFSVIAAVGVVAILRLTRNKTRRMSHLRLFIQALAVVAIFMGLVLGPFEQARYMPLGISPRDRLVGSAALGNQFPDGISFPVLACYYPNGRTVTCPVWQLQAYIFPFWNIGRGYDVFYSTQGLERLAIVVGILVGMSILLGRFFCGWLCPFGLYMDLLSKIRKFFGKHHLSLSKKSNTALGQLRYIIIAAFLVLSVIFGSYAISGIEIIPGTIPGGPLGTEAGIVGQLNEPFCLVCPMRPLCVLGEVGLGFLNWNYVSAITFGPFYISGFYITSLNMTILILVTILSLAYRRFWCRICPLGGLTALFSTFWPFKRIALTRLHKKEELCTKCGICKRVCPTQVTEVYDLKGGDVTVSGCMLCLRCVEMCPEKGTLKLKFAGKDVVESRNWVESIGVKAEPDSDEA